MQIMRDNFKVITRKLVCEAGANCIKYHEQLCLYTLECKTMNSVAENSAATILKKKFRN